ncbi:MAG: hypothetical protein VB997_04505, partial [Opitutales bacterium]
MVRNFSILLALASAFSLARLPLGVVQVGAWVDMFNEFVEQTGSVAISAEWTFDGDHRCSVCEYVGEETGKDEEQSTSNETSFTKILLGPLDMGIILVEPAQVIGRLVTGTHFPSIGFFETDIPPPRVA